MKLDFGILYNIQDDRLARVKLLNQMDHSTCITTIWHLIFRDVAVNQSIPKPVPVQNKYTEIQTHVCCDPMCSQHAKIRVWRLIDDFVDTYGDGEITRVVYDVQLAWCILTGEMGHPPRRKCDKIYKRNVSSFRELSFKNLSWVFPVNHSQQYKTTPPSPAVSLPFFKLNRPSDGSKLSQNRESWGKKLQKEPASQANPFNVNNSGRKWISKYGFTLLKEADSIRKICSSFWCRDIPFVYRFECVTVGPHVLPNATPAVWRHINSHLCLPAILNTCSHKGKLRAGIMFHCTSMIQFLASKKHKPDLNSKASAKMCLLSFCQDVGPFSSHST